VLGVAASLVLGPGVGIVAGGLLGPLAGMAVPEGRVHLQPESDLSGQPVDIDLAVAEAGGLDATPAPAAPESPAAPVSSATPVNPAANDDAGPGPDGSPEQAR
jgi:hypothetical protein